MLGKRKAEEDGWKPLVVIRTITVAYCLMSMKNCMKSMLLQEYAKQTEVSDEYCQV
jgi:hypothetical protein